MHHLNWFFAVVFMLCANSIVLAQGDGDVGACCFDNSGCVELWEAQCLAEGGEWQGAGTTCADAECGGGDGMVGVNDILILLANWGSCI